MVQALVRKNASLPCAEIRRYPRVGEALKRSNDLLHLRVFSTGIEVARFYQACGTR